MQLGTAFTAVGFAAASRTRRKISFANLDEERAIRYLRSFPTQAFNLWGLSVRRCGCKDRMEFGTEILPRCSHALYLTPAEARSRSLAGLQRMADLLEVKSSIVGRSEPGRIDRSKEEEVVWQRLVHPDNQGHCDGRAELSLSWVRSRVHPCSLEGCLHGLACDLWKRY